MSRKYIIATVILLALLACYITFNPKGKHTDETVSSDTSLEDRETFHNNREDKAETAGYSISSNSSTKPKELIKQIREGDDNKESTSPKELELNSISDKLVQQSDRNEKTYINSGTARNLDNVEFNKLLNELSYSNTEASAEYKYKYNIEISDSLANTNISIIGIECNDTICAASLNYDHSTLDEVEEKIKNADLDTSVLIFVGDGITNGTRSANMVLSAGRAVAGIMVSKEDN